MKSAASWMVGLVSVVLATSGLTTGCAVHGKAKASASANEVQASSDSDIDGAFSGAPPASTGTVASRPAPAPAPTSVPTTASETSSTPPPDACPLTCYEASGATRMPLTPEETAQIRAALEPALSKMRACESPAAWKQQGSPTLHLRLDADGKLAELDVDPSRGDTGCFDSAALSSNVSVTLSGRNTVRCAERCEHESARRALVQGKPKSAGKGKKPAR